MSGKRTEKKLVPTDPRFASLGTDPRFVRKSRRKDKVVVDERFSSLFEPSTTESAAAGPSVDRYGRRVGKDRSRDELKRFYRLDKDEAGDQEARPDYARGEGLIESSDEDDEDAQNDEQASDRGLLSEVESDEDSDEDEIVVLGNRRRRQDSEVSIDLDEDELRAVQEVEPSVPEHLQTRRLAIVNLDWDHVRAVDLFKVFASVLSATSTGSSTSASATGSGRVERVAIYPSEFGQERMAKEDLAGPPKELFKPLVDGEAQDGPEYNDGDEYDERALRRYQLERLRYYYAIAEFSSVKAARRVFDEIDGTELEKTANMFNLRSVPDDMTFDEATLRDECTADTIDYKSVDYVTDALRNSKVKLTWDADDPQRARVTRLDASKLKDDDLNKLDVSQYLASSGSENEDEDGEENAADAKKQRMRALLGLDALTANASKRDRDEGMTITFASALDGKRPSAAATEESTMEAYKRKEKERKAKRKAERADKTGDEDAVVEDVASDDSDSQIGDADAAPVADELGFDHPFFASGSEAEDHPPAPAQTKKASKAQRKLDREASDRQKAELQLLVDPESDDEALAAVTGGPAATSKHFDMKAILKAEKDAGEIGNGKKRSRKRKHKKGAETTTAPAAGDGFEVDVTDERFKRLHEDPEMAIDPSSTHFVKSRNTMRLLDESRKRRREEPAAAPASAEQPSVKSKSLDSLVASIKSKSAKAKEPKRRKI